MGVDASTRGLHHGAELFEKVLALGQGAGKERQVTRITKHRVEHGGCVVPCHLAGSLAGCVRFRKECSRLVGACHRRKGVTQFSHLRGPPGRANLCGDPRSCSPNPIWRCCVGKLCFRIQACIYSQRPLPFAAISPTPSYPTIRLPHIPISGITLLHSKKELQIPLCLAD
jgi:hypothetical protein